MARMFAGLLLMFTLLLSAIAGCTHRYQPASTDLTGIGLNAVHARQGNAGGANHARGIVLG